MRRAMFLLLGALGCGDVNTVSLGHLERADAGPEPRDASDHARDATADADDDHHEQEEEHEEEVR